MKNKTSLLTIATLLMLAACGSKTEIMKSGLADKFAKLDKDTTFASVGSSNNSTPKLERNKDGKWQYVIDNKQTGTNRKILATFDVDSFVKVGDFDVSETKDMKVTGNAGQEQIFKVKLKLAGTNLTYGHYGFAEANFKACNNSGQCVDQKGANSFFVMQNGKGIENNFVKPAEKTIYKGSTHAFLTAGERNDYIAGNAELEFSGNVSTGNLTLNYNDTMIKKVEARGVDFANNMSVDKWLVNNTELQNNGVQSPGNIVAKTYNMEEIVGAYGLNGNLNGTGFELRGGFGLKK